jgi:hypothetical protein
MPVPAVPAKYVALGQLRQVALEFAPTVLEYLPDSQETQVSIELAVTTVEYFPAGQAEHVSASSYE